MNQKRREREKVNRQVTSSVFFWQWIELENPSRQSEQKRLFPLFTWLDCRPDDVSLLFYIHLVGRLPYVDWMEEEKKNQIKKRTKVAADERERASPLLASSLARADSEFSLVAWWFFFFSYSLFFLSSFSLFSILLFFLLGASDTQRTNCCVGECSFDRRPGTEPFHHQRSPLVFHKPLSSSFSPFILRVAHWLFLSFFFFYPSGRWEMKKKIYNHDFLFDWVVLIGDKRWRTRVCVRAW